MKIDINNYMGFSINNVSQAFKRIAECQIDSIFDDALFFKLKEWNRNYNLKTKLFVVESDLEKNIRKIKPKCLKELYENRDWLQIEWGTYDIDGIFDAQKYGESFLRFNETIKQCIGVLNRRRSIRLGFDCTDERFLDFLTGEGVDVFYSNHIKKNIYDFNGDLSVFYGARKVNLHGRDYRLTDIDLSDKSIDCKAKLNNVIFEAVNKYKFYNHIIVTCVDESEFNINIETIEKMICLLPKTYKTLYLDAFEKYKDDFYFISNGINIIFKLHISDMSVSIFKVLNSYEMEIYESSHKIAFYVEDIMVEIKEKNICELKEDGIKKAKTAYICWSDLKHIAVLKDTTINESRWFGLTDFVNEVIGIN